MHEEDGQADVEQDDHADHDGVGTLEKRSVRWLSHTELTNPNLHQLEEKATLLSSLRDPDHHLNRHRCSEIIALSFY